MKSRIGALAVGLAADCDAPESDVNGLMNENLKSAQMLPFVAVVTPQGKWVAGYSGYKDEAGFAKFLDEVEKSPVLDATEAVKKKLAGLAEKAGKAADKGEWKSVVGAAKEASETTGRCPERKTLEELLGKARAWAAGKLDSVAKSGAAAADLAPARGVLGEVKKHMAGEPEAAEAEAGLKALQRLSNLRTAEAGPAPPAGIREKARKEYAGTRWAPLFERAEAAPAEAPRDDPK